VAVFDEPFRGFLLLAQDRGIMQSMVSRLPLPALLSFGLVAFTVEFDNETEYRMLHWTTIHGTSSSAGRGPWLVSMAMGFNCMFWIPEDGIAVRDLERRARTRTNWDGMRRWGYIYFEPSPEDDRPKPPQSALIVRATSKGRLAQGIWRALLPEIEERWRQRYGSRELDSLRGELTAIARQLNAELPDCMPILKYGLVGEGPRSQKSAANFDNLSDLSLPVLLARVLLAFALEFEHQSDLSLAICANVLRIVEELGTDVREIPARSGVSKEAIAMALGLLTKRGYASIANDPRTIRAKKVLLTPRGVQAQLGYADLVRTIEDGWETKYGRSRVAALREALEPMVGDGSVGNSLLFRGLEPHPEGWRALAAKPVTLPHYPMVLHRGGYPDGS
jgi:DNA-binding MarR family transcriptional regulator